MWFWYNATCSVLVYQKWSESVFSALALFTLFGSNPEPPWLNHSTSALQRWPSCVFPLPAQFWSTTTGHLLFFMKWSKLSWAGPHHLYRKQHSYVFSELFQCCFVRADPLQFLLWKNGSGPDKMPPAQCNFREQNDSILPLANCFWSSSSGRFRSASDLVARSTVKFPAHYSNFLGRQYPEILVSLLIHLSQGHTFHKMCHKMLCFLNIKMSVGQFTETGLMHTTKGKPSTSSTLWLKSNYYWIFAVSIYVQPVKKKNLPQCTARC